MVDSASLHQNFIGRLGRSGAEPDAHQQRALNACTELVHRLDQRSAGSASRRLWDLIPLRWLRRKPANGVTGLYLWGSVGRGKTLMMDTLLEALPPKTWRRVHFHRFMLEIHDGLRRLKDEKDPLRRISR